MLLTVDNAGKLAFIWDDDLTDLAAAGKARVLRAGQVEPDYYAKENGGDTWMADLRLSGGPILGPFRRQGEALAAEVAWLEENVFGASPSS